MRDIAMIWRMACFNFRQWKKNPRVIMTFVLAFVLCLLLTDKAVSFAQRYGTTMQIMEPFVWTFGDPNSIMISSLLLILLFADMPFISAVTPYFLSRASRRAWVWGQIVYVTLSSLLYMLFILAVTVIISAPLSFVGNMWSETGALVGYSGIEVALPASVKTMEMSYPYACALNVFALMTLYTLFVVSVMLVLNLRRGKFWGVAGVFMLSVYGLILNPQTIAQLFGIRDAVFYKANVAVGWLSPLNHATYYMHNFGYDYLPRLWMTYLIFALLIAACFFIALRGIRRYSFAFTGN